jgi:hypothetical protein
MRAAGHSASPAPSAFFTMSGGAIQRNEPSVVPLNVHSTAAGFICFLGLAAGAEAGIGADADADAEAASGAEAEAAADATTGADAGATVAAEPSICPSTTTRDPSIPTPAWEMDSLSDDFSASVLRIICSHVLAFLYVAQPAIRTGAVAMHKSSEIRIFIEVPWFGTPAIVA